MSELKIVTHQALRHRLTARLSVGQLLNYLVLSPLKMPGKPYRPWPIVSIFPYRRPLSNAKLVVADSSNLVARQLTRGSVDTWTLTDIPPFPRHTKAQS